MAKEYSRTRRIGEQMQRELAELIQREVKDPRVGMVTVSAVEVSRDLAHAKVYVSSLLTPEKMDDALVGLSRAAGFLRRELGRRMALRTIPQLHFVHDISIEEGNRLSALIDEAVAKDRHDDDGGQD